MVSKSGRGNDRSCNRPSTKTLKRAGVGLAFSLLLSSCIVVPMKDAGRVNKCEISSDHKVLRVVDLARESNSYYSISGLLLLPLTGVVSGTYVAVNNVYHLGQETIVCQ
jgi:hypothetical protein